MMISSTWWILRCVRRIYGRQYGQTIIFFRLSAKDDVLTIWWCLMESSTWWPTCSLCKSDLSLDWWWRWMNWMSPQLLGYCFNWLSFVIDESTLMLHEYDGWPRRMIELNVLVNDGWTNKRRMKMLAYRETPAGDWIDMASAVDFGSIFSGDALVWTGVRTGGRWGYAYHYMTLLWHTLLLHHFPAAQVTIHTPSP